jgi:hypothetical protein
MALVIEDGTIVTGANSYIDIDGAKEYASSRGVDLGTDDALTEQRLLNAMDYLESQNFKGSRTDPDNQALAWPRIGVIADGRTYGSNAIPQQLKSAQAQLAIEQFNGVKIFSSTTASAGSDAQVVKREKIDVIETEYMTATDLGTASVLAVADMPTVTALLRGLLRGMQPLFAYRG